MELVRIEDNKVGTDSRLVADAFNKNHHHVIRDIESLQCSKDFFASNFGLIQIVNDLGLGRKRLDKGYTMTRDGFTFLAMGYTGARAAQFKEAYINAFNEMEAKLKDFLPRSNDNDRISVLEKKFAELTLQLTQAGLYKFLEHNVAIKEISPLTIEPVTTVTTTVQAVDKYFTVAEYVKAKSVETPNSIHHKIAKIAIKWCRRLGYKITKKDQLNSYPESALDYAVKKFNESVEKQKASDIEFLKKNSIAQDLKALQKGEYMIFRARLNNPDVPQIVYLINRSTDLRFSCEYRNTANPSFKVTKIK